MQRFWVTILLFSTLSLDIAAQQTEPSTALFADCINHWYLTRQRGDYERYTPDQYIEIADNLLAYQNEDGGWPKNIDWLAKLDSKEVIDQLGSRARESTLDNRNIYPQCEFLAQVYAMCGDDKYKQASQRAIDYMLRTQYPNGGWRGWDADAITYNDACMAGVMRLWKRIIEGTTYFGWLDSVRMEQIEQSWNRALELTLKCQYIQNGVKSIWAQQHDHQTLLPVKARSYEHPSLAASESADIVMLLMSIKNPTPEIIDAVKCAVRWFEQNKIEGKRVVTVEMPEGNPDDRAIKRDRYLVDDPKAEPLWGRFYELSDNTVFLCNRDGIKVYTLKEVAPERRVGYSWYGTWGCDVFKRYQKWLKEIEE